MIFYRNNISADNQWVGEFQDASGKTIFIRTNKIHRKRKKNEFKVDMRTKTVTIALSQGYKTTVSLSTWEWLKNFRLYAITSKTMSENVYAATSFRTSENKTKIVPIHRLIVDCPDGRKATTVVDHEDGNGLNNVERNIHLITRSENTLKSKMFRSNKSGARNVSMLPNGTFLVTIPNEGRFHVKRGFETLEDAIKYRDMIKAAFKWQKKGVAHGN